MIIVIDAYNLLHAMPFYKKTLTDLQRARFIKQLAVYGQRKGHKMVLVFDGGRFEWPQKEKIHSVYVIYSGIHESADDYIKDYLEKNRSKDLLLVSSDTEINRYAQRISIPSIDSVGFCVLLNEALQEKNSVQTNSQAIVKMTQDTSYDIDELMINAAKNMPVKADDIGNSQTKNVKSNRMNKQDRALLKKLNKL